MGSFSNVTSFFGNVSGSLSVALTQFRWNTVLVGIKLPGLEYNNQKVEVLSEKN